MGTLGLLDRPELIRSVGKKRPTASRPPAGRRRESLLLLSAVFKLGSTCKRWVAFSVGCKEGRQPRCYGTACWCHIPTEPLYVMGVTVKDNRVRSVAQWRSHRECSRPILLLCYLL